MKRMIKMAALLFAVLFSLLLAAGCGQEQEAAKKVSLLFPDPAAGGPWKAVGPLCQKYVSEAGYDCKMEFCSSPQNQVEQLKAAIAQKPACIVLAVQDAMIFGDALKEAKEANIPVIAYDRLVMHTDAITYYASFDNSAVGEFMGRYVEEKLNLKGGAGPFTLEFVAGDPSDMNAPMFYQGAYDRLKPYIEKGQLVIPSGQSAFKDVATDGWSADKAKARMETILRQHYAGRNLDLVVAANDDLANAVLEAQKTVGYKGKPTLITGQDASDKALQNIREGRQAMTIYKDPNVLCAKVVRMVKAVVEGSQPAINDVQNIKNDVKTIPSYLCIPAIVDKENIDVVKK